MRTVVSPHLLAKSPCNSGNKAPMCLGRCLASLLRLMSKRVTVVLRDDSRTEASCSMGSMTSQIVELNLQGTLSEAAMQIVKIFFFLTNVNPTLCAVRNQILL